MSSLPALRVQIPQVSRLLRAVEALGVLRAEADLLYPGGRGTLALRRTRIEDGLEALSRSLKKSDFKRLRLRCAGGSACDVRLREMSAAATGLRISFRAERCATAFETSSNNLRLSPLRIWKNEFFYSGFLFEK